MRIYVLDWFVLVALVLFSGCALDSYAYIGDCNCSTCDECELELNTACTYVNLTADIVSYTETCIDNPENFSNKVLDCRGNRITYYDPSLVLLHHYNKDFTFGENGSLVYDHSGHGNNGTIYGAFGYTIGKYGKAVHLYDHTGYVNVGNGSSLNISTITVELWVKPAELPWFDYNIA